MTGPVEPLVTLNDIAADASLILCWTISSLTHVPVSVCVGTWGVGDPTPTYAGNPVVVYVQLGDLMRVVKMRAVEVLLLSILRNNTSHNSVHKMFLPPSLMCRCSVSFSAMLVTARNLPGAA